MEKFEFLTLGEVVEIEIVVRKEPSVVTNVKSESPM